MKNIVNEKPTDDLHGRLKTAVDFIADVDVKNRVILDIGCGYGWCELDLLKRGVKKVVASEVTKKDLETIKKYIKNPKIVFNVASAVKLPFKNNTFDTVICWEVLEHIPNNTERLMFKEVARVLKPNGVMYLSTPYKSIASTIFDPAWWLIGHRHYTKKSLKEYAESNGFVVERMMVKGRVWELIGILNMYFSKWILGKRTEGLVNYITKKIDEEYKSEGFMDIFIKVKKGDKNDKTVLS